jgi:hypothetical protein
MTSRNVMPGDTTQKPGPGQHSPEVVSGWMDEVRGREEGREDRRKTTRGRG